MKKITIGICLVLILGGEAWASDPPNWERLANAIYKAEGGAKTRHPYGILAKYKHTTPRQACINTCKHKYRDWIALGAKGDYIDYLGSKYAPRGVLNDPHDLNRNWIKNVKAGL